MQSECIALQKGIIAVPVADLIGQPIKSLFPSYPVEYSYRHLPWSCYQSQYAANARLHQLLFHEQVTIISKTKDEVCIEVPNVFYITTQSTIPHTLYWTHLKNILPLSELPQIEKSHLPPAIDFRNPDTLNNQKIVSLIEPWHSKRLDLTFSAGTRFIVAPQNKRNHVAVYALNPHTHSTQTIHIPRQFLHSSNNTSKQQKVQSFLKIIRRWAHAQSGSLGYVFGGCSYIQTHAENNFTLKPSILTLQKLSHYERPHAPDIKTGFDCSNLILRAAQIVGLPYFYKNTHTLAQRLRPVLPHESISSGDLIWIPGHVIIVSDAQRNHIIEAHSYDGGYGKVHEIPLCKIFRGITTCADLQKTHKNGTLLQRLDSKGNVQQSYPKFKILKLTT